MLKQLLLLALTSAALLAKDWYVSPNGTPKSPGTEKAPFNAISDALKGAKPGDTIHIGKGLYREQLDIKTSGTPDAPIVFQGERGPNGEFLTILENKGTVLTDWTPAPEIAPNV